MSDPNPSSVSIFTLLEHIHAAQAALRFECLRSARDGMRVNLLDALAGLSEAEGILVEALQSSSPRWTQTFGSVHKWSKRAMKAIETYYDDLVEAPGIGTNLAAVLALLPVPEPQPEPAPAPAPPEGASS